MRPQSQTFLRLLHSTVVVLPMAVIAASCAKQVPTDDHRLLWNIGVEATLEPGGERLRRMIGTRTSFIPFRVRYVPMDTDWSQPIDEKWSSHWMATVPAGNYLVQIDAGGVQRNVPASVKDGMRFRAKVSLDGGVLDYSAYWHGTHNNPADHCQVYRILSPEKRVCMYTGNHSSDLIVVPPGNYAIESVCGNERREVLQSVEIAKTYFVRPPFNPKECRKLAKAAGIVP